MLLRRLLLDLHLVTRPEPSIVEASVADEAALQLIRKASLL
jgi:hypothetical protein